MKEKLMAVEYWMGHGRESVSGQESRRVEPKGFLTEWE
jgi:hypothetical protein